MKTIVAREQHGLKVVNNSDQVVARYSINIACACACEQITHIFFLNGVKELKTYNHDFGCLNAVF